ncbi:hypothetical protein GCM10027517_32870 [Phycicoccus ginsengisoli]
MCAGVVHVVRENVVDVAVFLGTGLLMLVLLRRDLPTRGGPSWLSARWPAVGAASVVGLAVATQTRDSVTVQLALAAAGVVALVLVLRAGAGAPALEATPAARSWVWVSLLLVGSVVELANFLAQPDAQTDNPDHPTISAIVDPMLGGHPSRTVVAVVWVLAGWWLVRVLVERAGGSR